MTAPFVPSHASRAYPDDIYAGANLSPLAGREPAPDLIGGRNERVFPRSFWVRGPFSASPTHRFRSRNTPSSLPLPAGGEREQPLRAMVILAIRTL
jgi:hypothetical protein